MSWLMESKHLDIYINMPQELEISRQPLGIVLSYQLIIFEIIKSLINFDYKK